MTKNQRILVVNDSLSKKNSTAIKEKPKSEYMDLLEKSGLLKKSAMIEAHSEKFVDFRSTDRTSRTKRDILNNTISDYMAYKDPLKVPSKLK